MCLRIYKYYLACPVILGSVSGIIRYSSIIQEHTHAYSEPWHILVTKHNQTPRYIHNTILNIFTKASSWSFDKVLNAAPLKDAILYGVFNVIFEIYSGKIKIYSAIFILVKAY